MWENRWDEVAPRQIGPRGLAKAAPPAHGAKSRDTLRGDGSRGRNFATAYHPAAILGSAQWVLGPHGTWAQLAAILRRSGAGEAARSSRRMMLDVTCSP